MKKDNQSGKKSKELIKPRVNIQKLAKKSHLPLEEMESLCGYYRGRAGSCRADKFISTGDENDLLF